MPEVLIVTANSTKQPLSLTREIRTINEILDKKGNFYVRCEFECRISDLIRRLKESCPDILHFACHGMGGGAEALYLAGDHGNPAVVTASDLTKIFENISERPKIVFLNACFSAELASELTKWVDIVIGINGKINDELALKFSAYFYSALGPSTSIRSAYDLASLQLSSLGANDDSVLLRTKENIDAKAFILYTQPQLIAQFALSKTENPKKSGKSYNIILSLTGVDHTVDSATFQICDDSFEPEERYWEILRSESPTFTTYDLWTEGDLTIRVVLWSRDKGIGFQCSLSDALYRHYGAETPPNIIRSITEIKNN